MKKYKYKDSIGGDSLVKALFSSFCRRLFSLIKCVVIKLAIVPVFLMVFEQVVYAGEIRAFPTYTHAPATLSDQRSASLNLKSAALEHSGAWFNFKTPKPSNYKVSPFTSLPILADGATAMPSNANNFHGEASASVDPRTGSASYTMPLASTMYDNGQSKRDFTISYSGGSSALGPDPFSLGSHWTFNIGTEHQSTSEISDHQTTDITTSDGHSFTMVSDRNSQGGKYWHPLRHKLGDVTITGQPGDWTIAMSSGVREHLLYGYEDWEEGRDGERVWFYYDRNGPQDTTRRLLYVCNHPLTEAEVHSSQDACANNGIHITYEGNDITVHGQQPIVLHMGNMEGQPILQTISMPPLSSSQLSNYSMLSGAKSGDQSLSANLQFAYDNQGERPWLLKSVTTPSGKKTTFLYNSESDHNALQSQGLPTGFGSAHIPVVTEEITATNIAGKKAVPDQRTWYQYSKGTSDQHNYTGYQSGVSSEPGKDNLFDRSDDYTYTVTVDNGLTTATTTYNKYHLPLSAVQTEDLRHSLISQSDSAYLPWKGTKFSDLAPTYSFPKNTTKTLFSVSSKGQDQAITPAKVIEHKQYNNDGQVVWKEDAYGRQTFTQYCPRQGDNHCPAMDPSWPQVALPEKVLTLPATQSPAGSAPFTNFAATGDPASAVEVVFDYKRIPQKKKFQNRVKQYAAILRQQWKKQRAKWKTLEGESGLLSTSDVFSQTRLMDDIGQNTSDTSGSWQVLTKQVGTLSPASVATVKPGQALPDLNADQLFTAVNYQYNLQQDSPVFGQLTQMTLTKYNQDTPTVNGRLLREGVTALAVTQQEPQQITFSIKHDIDTKMHTRTTDVEVVHAQHYADIQNATQLLQMGSGGGLSLGKSVYSLTNGMKLSSDDTLKTLHINWVYDAWQRPVKETVTPETGGKPQSISWIYMSTADEQSVVKTLSNGSQQKIIYAGSGKDQKVLSAWHRNKSQSSAPMEGISNWVEDSSMTYTTAGKQATKTTYHAADGNGKTIALTTTYGYDSLNRPVWEKDPDGSVNVTVRNDPAMLLIGYKVLSGVNSQGEKLAPMLSVVQSNTLNKPVAQYSFPLDAKAILNGKPLYSSELQSQLTALKSQLEAIGSLQPTQSYGLLPLAGDDGLFGFVSNAIKTGSWLTRISTQYDGNGRMIKQVQPNGAQTHWKWQNGNMVATIAPNGSLIHDTYNLQGKKVARCVQPAGQSVCHVLGTRGYDDEGNLAWKADEYGNKINYTYDSDGRITSTTIPATKTSKSHVFTYTYNSFAKTSELLDGVVFATFSYDPDTWQLTDSEDTISHLHYDYDADTGALIKVTRSSPVKLKSPEGIHYPSGSESITYDRYGQPVSYTDMSGDTFTATHDSLGRILRSEVTLKGQNKPTLLSATTYDNYFNRVDSVVNGIGIVRTYVYGTDGQVASTIDKQNDKVLQQLDYAYDMQTGNITRFTRTEGKESATQTYTYDGNSNSLTDMTCSVTGKAGTPSALCPRDTDLSGSQLTVPPIITAQHYSFDDWNNIKTVKEQLSTKDGKSTSKITTYTYATGSGNNSDAAEDDSYDPHRMTAFGTQWQANFSRFSAVPGNISYDALGRIVKDADGNTLHYNAFGRQDKFTNSHTGETTSYWYDDSAHQVAEQPFDSKGQALQQPLYMLYQGDSVVAQVQNDAQGKTHISQELGLAHSEDGNINRWYLHDYKGDVISAFNGSGQKISDHVYSPYGMDDNLLDNAQNALPAKLKLASQSPWWQSHQPGFDGQMNDPATGYQFLGGGYRAYNPVYRHFMSHDSYSPFQKINGYGFGDNNPIMNTDPTGHMPKWMGYVMGGLSIGLAVAAAVLLPGVGVLFSISSTAASSAGFGVVATGITASATVAKTAMSGVIIGALASTDIASGSLQIASTARPEDKNLAIANQAMGVVGGVALAAMGAATVIGATASVLSVGARAVNSMIVLSGLFTVAGGASFGADSGLALGMTTNSDLARSAGMASAVKLLGYVSMGLMAVATVLSVAAAARMSLKYFKKFGKFVRGDSSIGTSTTWLDHEDGIASQNGDASPTTSLSKMDQRDVDNLNRLLTDKNSISERKVHGRTSEDIAQWVKSSDQGVNPESIANRRSTSRSRTPFLSSDTETVIDKNEQTTGVTPTFEVDSHESSPVNSDESLGVLYSEKNEIDAEKIKGNDENL